MAILNSRNCVTKKCDTCSFFQIESTSVDSTSKSDTVVAVCKPNYLLIGGLVALIIASPILYKKLKTV
jgi:hypothetical protein